MTPKIGDLITLHGVTVQIRAIVAGWVVCKGDGKYFVKRVGGLGEWVEVEKTNV